MDQSEVVIENSHHCRRCSSCRSWIRCTTIDELQKILASCQRCRANKSTKTKNTPFTRTGFDLDEYYQTHEDFIESVSSFLELNDNHIADADLQSLRIKAILAPDLRYKRVVILLRNDMFDFSGYFFHLRRVTERKNGPKFHLSCSRPLSLHISFSKSNGSAVMIYEHCRHPQTAKFHMTPEIYQNLLRMIDSSQFERTEVTYDHEAAGV
ncbi:hypothetical protein V1505DRAFT_400265 [Lipomyces doorenjongii]